MNERHQVAIAGMGLAALTTAARLTELGITEIALSCGFQSPSYYAEIFQQHKGCTPSHYRMRQAEGYEARGCL